MQNAKKQGLYKLILSNYPEVYNRHASKAMAPANAPVVNPDLAAPASALDTVATPVPVADADCSTAVPAASLPTADSTAVSTAVVSMAVELETPVDATTVELAATEGAEDVPERTVVSSVVCAIVHGQSVIVKVVASVTAIVLLLTTTWVAYGQYVVYLVTTLSTTVV